MKLESARTLHCFNLRLQKKGLGIYKNKDVGKKMNALFEHTKICPHSCVVATTDEVKEMACVPCKVYALLHIKAHDATAIADAAKAIAEDNRRHLGQTVKEALKRHVRACEEKLECPICCKIGIALRKDMPARGSEIFDAYKDLCVRQSFASS